MAKKTTILLVEDSEVHAEFIRGAFKPVEDQVDLTLARSLGEARAHLERHTPDLAIIDLFLPDGRGVELLEHGEGECGIPAIILSSQGDEELAVEAIKAGALDYLVKSPSSLLEMPYLAERALREWGHIKARRQAERKVRQLAYYDPLTGLANRAMLMEKLQTILAEAVPAHRLGAVLFLDLDRFKTINDTLGHALGDRLLVETAHRLRYASGEQGTVARFGGDEFVVLLPDLDEPNEAAMIAGNILESMSAPFDLGGREVYTTISIGIALFPEDSLSAETLFTYADLAMYAAKEAGRNTHCFFREEMTRKAALRLEMETLLRRALRQGDFFLAFQPKVNCFTGEVTGVEALLRLRGPEGRLISAGEMLDVAEKSGLIHPLWEWSLQTACTENLRWQREGGPPVRVSINVPGHKFKDPGVEQLVDRVLKETGLDPRLLELELIEGMLMEDAGSAVGTLRALKKRGVGLVIDDFGIGCSSLLHLKEFPLDRIKIARHFIRGVPCSPTDTAIVEAIMAMAGKLRLEVTAVGVETAEQVRFLRACRCQELQGFYFAPPLASDDIASLLSEGLPRSGACPFGAGYR